MKPGTKFIFTKDEKTKDKLIEAGYKLISENAGGWKFINKNELVFDKYDNVFITDTLTF